MKRLSTLRCVLFVKCKNQNKNLQTDIISYGKNMSFDDKIVYKEAEEVFSKWFCTVFMCSYHWDVMKYFPIPQ